MLSLLCLTMFRGCAKTSTIWREAGIPILIGNDLVARATTLNITAITRAEAVGTNDLEVLEEKRFDAVSVHTPVDLTDLLDILVNYNLSELFADRLKFKQSGNCVDGRINCLAKVG